MNIQELREKLSKVDLLSAYPFINGYGISTKTNRETGNDELVVEFNVSKKIDKFNIKGEYLLPKSLSAFDIDIKTKVTERLVPSIDCKFQIDEIINYTGTVAKHDEFDKMQNNFLPLLEGAELLGKDSIIPTAARFNSTFNVEPVKSNRQKARPLSGGCSSIYYDNGTDATLGLLVRDTQDRSIVALSNSHVYSDVLLIGEEAARYGTENNMLTLSARQPGNRLYNDFGNLSPAIDHIGIPKRTSYLSILNDKNNFVDACTVDLSSNLIDESSNSVIWFKEKGPYQFATTEEIYSLMDPSSLNYRSPVFRSGRTLGPLGYPGNIREDKTIPISITSYVSAIDLTPSLTASDGTNIFSAGINSIKTRLFRAFDNEYFTTFYKSSDNQKVYIQGNRHFGWFNRPDYSTLIGPGNLFPSLTGDFKDVELAIQDSNGIKTFYRGVYNAFYVNDNNQIYCSGQRPNYGVADVIPISADPYFSHLENVSNNRGEVYLDPWTEMVLNNTDITAPGIKKIFLGSGRNYILTNNDKLFVKGWNAEPPGNSSSLPGYEYNSIGHGNSTQIFTSFTQVPGEWLDFADFGTVILAISSDNRLCAAFNHTTNLGGGPLGGSTDVLNDPISSYDYFGSNGDGGLVDDYTTVTHKASAYTTGFIFSNYLFHASYNLTDNVIPITIDDNEVFVKKIITIDDKLGRPQLIDGCNAINLVTTDDKLINLYGKRSIGDGTNNAVYIKHNNQPVIWNSTCKKLGDGPYGYKNTAFISGGNIFMYGRNVKIDRSGFDDGRYMEEFGRDTTYPLLPILDKWGTTECNGTSAFKYDNFPNFDSIAGHFGAINVGDDSPGYNAILYFSNSNGVSAIGANYNGVLGDTGYYKDKLIVNSVDTTSNVNFGLPAPIFFKNLFTIQSKEKIFSVAEGGDSGTAVFAQLSSTVPAASAWKCIGLLFAGAPTPANDAEGACVMIENIVNELDIEPWEGDI